MAGSPATTATPGPAPGSAPGRVVLEIDGVSAGYGKVQVLRDISFGVHDGEIVALLGPNGCGKTTLLRVIGKLLEPTVGSVRVVGWDVLRMSQAEFSRIVASVAQVHRTTFPFTALDILLTGRMPYVSVFSSPDADDVRFCREVLEWFGIGHLEKQPISMLSGGERQLVMIARALAQEPRVLLLDEPTTHLDLRNQVRVLDTIGQQAKAQGLTVLMTIHDPNQAFAYADRAVLLRKLAAPEGVDSETMAQPRKATTNIIASGEPAAVLTPGNVEEAYGVAVDVIEHARHRLLVPAE